MSTTHKPRTPSSPATIKPLSKPPPLLTLPIELRPQICSHILPFTQPTGHDPANVLWHSSNNPLSFLLVSKQIHTECANILYGQNTFEFVVMCHRNIGSLHWVRKDGTIGRYCSDLDQIPVTRMRKVIVHVRGGTLRGESNQPMVDFVSKLAEAQDLVSMIVYLHGWIAEKSGQEILQPLNSLKNVKYNIDICSVDSDTIWKWWVPHESKRAIGTEPWWKRTCSFKPSEDGEALARMDTGKLYQTIWSDSDTEGEEESDDDDNDDAEEEDDVLSSEEEDDESAFYR